MTTTRDEPTPLPSPRTIGRGRPGRRDDSSRVELRRRLQEERRFRVEQLAALGAETPASERHENVARLLCVSATVALAEIDAALRRMEDGCYGLCVSCGGQISAERLTVLPMAPLCMNCHYNEQNCRLADVVSPRRS